MKTEPPQILGILQCILNICSSSIFLIYAYFGEVAYKIFSLSKRIIKVNLAKKKKK